MSAADRMGPDRARPLSVRASDADRESVLDLLQTHGAEGRLDERELEERTEAALSARTRGDLAALLYDLPATGPPSARARRASGWRDHVATYLAVNALLVALWALTGFGYFWPVWPIMGWGIALLAHGRWGRPPRRLARTAVEQALGVRPDRPGAPSGGAGQPALER